MDKSTESMTLSGSNLYLNAIAKRFILFFSIEFWPKEQFNDDLENLLLKVSNFDPSTKKIRYDHRKKKG